MKIPFSKYHGAGNDFIIIDNRLALFDKLSTEQIQLLCHRRFGIGADGLMKIQNDTKYDFRMVYYNSDGKEGSMCGNGGRCITRYAQKLQLMNQSTRFITIDGEHEATIEGENIKLHMADVTAIDKRENYIFLNTGSPHYVSFVKEVMKLNVFDEGRKIRHNETFKEKGTNVNFVEKLDTKLIVRTYERGVEDETLSCGTGAVASAIAAECTNKNGVYKSFIQTKGGQLIVDFCKVDETNYNQIYLTGPAEFVFEGDFFLQD